MAIIGAGLKLAKKLLKNKSLQKAINVTTTQSNKLKEVAKAGASKAGAATVSAAKSAVNSNAAKKATKIATKTTRKAQVLADKVGSKIASKTPKSVKKVLKAGEQVIQGGGAVGAVVGAGIGAGLGKAKGKALRATKDFMAKRKGKPTKLGGTADKNMGKEARTFAQVEDTVDGAMTGADVGSFVAGGLMGYGAAAAITGGVSLTASMIKSSAPKEAQYKQEKLPDGRFVTGYSDANKNSVYSQKQLSSKETDEVRSLVALLDSIILSEDPSKRRKEFTETAQLLGGKYGISHITGKNLSIMMPTVMGNNRTLR